MNSNSIQVRISTFYTLQILWDQKKKYKILYMHWHLIITCIQVLSEFSSDLFSENDMYLTITHNKQTRKTTTNWDSSFCEWNDYIVFDIDGSSKTLVIDLTIYDEDKWSPDNEIFSKKIILDSEKTSCVHDGVQLTYGLFAIVPKGEFEHLHDDIESKNNLLATINALTDV